jgi:hypothetical protein
MIMQSKRDYIVPTIERIEAEVELGFSGSVVADDMYETEGSWD